MPAKINPQTFKWSEKIIGRAVVFQFFQRSVLAIPNCGWAGSEADMLVVTKNLRLIDIEVKISRSDLKADLAKSKWWLPRPWSRRHLPKQQRQWPAKIWKHYYVMPADIWHEDLRASLPPNSGILLVRADGRYDGGVFCWAMHPAKPCREAKPIDATDAVDLARLANLRMWSALTSVR